MKKIQLLDCTLRDGGYVNDWNFGSNVMTSIFERIVSAGIDYVEVGFLDQRQPFNPSRSINPGTQCYQSTFDGLYKGRTKIVGMIDYGTCDIDKIQPCKDSCFDCIRVIFKKHIMREALDFCKQLKSLGYKVFCNLVSTTSYNDSELYDLIEIINSFNPYAVSIVDTYGLMHKDGVLHYYEMLDKSLNPSIALAYHSHNNFQLAYSNCIELVGKHWESTSERTLILDGTLFGMGKGAGNAPIELLSMYMNDHYHGNYDISQLLEAVDAGIMDIFKQTPWGYSMKFFIAASNDCHPNYVSFLLEKKSLSVKSINEILASIRSDKKLMYDKDYIQDLYVNYQKEKCDDTLACKELKEKFSGQEILLIGPGKTIINEKDKIVEYVEKVKPIVVVINFIPQDVTPDFMFLTNAKRYIQQTRALLNCGDMKIIATSNLTRIHKEFDYIIDFETIIDKSAPFIDNSLLMFLRLISNMSPKHVALAGFDGYSSVGSVNYFTSKMEYDLSVKKGEEINIDVNKNLQLLKNCLNLEFITTTHYKF